MIKRTRLTFLLRKWDTKLSSCLQVNTQQRSLYAVAFLGAHLGDGWLWVTLFILGLVLGTDHLRQGLVCWFVASILAGALTTSTKFILRRRRPTETRGFYSHRYDQHSFPSGHATRMGTVAVFGPVLFPSWGWVALPVAFWVAWGRVAMGIHFVLDVTVGIGIGAALSLVVLSYCPG